MEGGLFEELEAHTEVRLGLAAANALSTMRSRWLYVGEDNVLLGELATQLAASEPYRIFAAKVLELADDRLARIHDGSEPFVADKAFTPEDARALERAGLVALTLDAEWAAPVSRILAQASVAPNPAVKAVPSQAAAFAMARAIMAAPTPETVSALADATSATRHAGIKKKFTRYTRDARRRLGSRPDVALRLAEEHPTKAQVTTWLKSVEGSWTVAASWDAARWIRAAFATSVTTFSEALVWQVIDGPSFLGRPGAFRDAAGRPVQVPDDARVRLWHPAASTDADRTAWREHVREAKLEQPFSQVFREHYDASDADRLVAANTVHDTRQVIGLYRSEGWRHDGDNTIARGTAAAGALLWFDASMYPGSGSQQCHPLGLAIGAPSFTAQGIRTLDAEPDAAAQSELVRSVDLILSASTIALDENGFDDGVRGDQTPAGVLATRRMILEHILAELPTTAVNVAARHIEVNGHRVSIATGRVTRDGDAVEVTPRRHHGLWQPATDRLLTTIVGTVVALLDEE
ncbi:DUF4132 domain-containing protein [Tsukamurella paurometabola]|uniref:DUF4132 domain-containing protein n=1 Tax=Tsukamurella paurometabola TaxID=2061 RepID=A0ABS5NEV7_TSUPA|nr:DUF4132 domain-containing protein [Tsukamurella paurometabola]MBS4102172.1 DUF4132 domain-containing protein [Tsukamurella paurometabola]